jgi:chromosome segregation ATPase
MAYLKITDVNGVEYNLQVLNEERDILISREFGKFISIKQGEMDKISEYEDKIADLEADLDEASGSADDLQLDVDNLENQISDLEKEVSIYREMTSNGRK